MKSKAGAGEEEHEEEEAGRDVSIIDELVKERSRISPLDVRVIYKCLAAFHLFYDIYIDHIGVNIMSAEMVLYCNVF